METLTLILSLQLEVKYMCTEDCGVLAGMFCLLRAWGEDVGSVYGFSKCMLVGLAGRRFPPVSFIGECVSESDMWPV